MPLPAGGASVPIKSNYAVLANRLSAALVSYITANAEVHGVETAGTTKFNDAAVGCSAGTPPGPAGGALGNTTASPGGLGGSWGQPAGNSGNII